MATELERLVIGAGKQLPSDEETVHAILTLVRRVILRHDATESARASPSDPWLTLTAGAEYASVSDDTLREWINSGILKAGRVGRVIRIRRSDIDALLSGKNGADESSRDSPAPSTEPSIVSVTSQTILTSMKRKKSTSVL